MCNEMLFDTVTMEHVLVEEQLIPIGIYVFSGFGVLCMVGSVRGPYPFYGFLICA